MSIARALDAITSLVVRSCDPDEVILFGSYAKGNPHPGSDIDLLIIGDFKTSHWIRSREVKDLLSCFPITVDLHLYTNEELDIARNQPYAFLATIQRHGISVYRRGFRPKP